MSGRDHLTVKQQVGRLVRAGAALPGAILGILLAEKIIKIHTAPELLLLLSTTIALIIIIKAIADRLHENAGYWPKPLNWEPRSSSRGASDDSPTGSTPST